MIRTQIQLTDEQARELKSLSTRTGLSIAELVRRGLAPLLREAGAADDERARRALAVVGRFRSGQSDIATEHDRYLMDV